MGLGSFIKRNIKSANNDISNVFKKGLNITPAMQLYKLKQKQEQDLIDQQQASQERLIRLGLTSNEDISKDQAETAETLAAEAAKRTQMLIIGIIAALVVAIIGFVVLPRLLKNK